jgi:hypothetical protein
MNELGCQNVSAPPVLRLAPQTKKTSRLDDGDDQIPLPKPPVPRGNRAKVEVRGGVFQTRYLRFYTNKPHDECVGCAVPLAT